MASDALSLLLAQALKDQESYKTEPLYQMGTQLGSYHPFGPESGLNGWQSLLVGALSGLGGGILQGIGRGMSSDSNSVESLAKVIGAAPAERESIAASDPKLSKYSSILKIADALDKQELTDFAEKERLKSALNPKLPKLVNMQQGSENVTYSQDPLTGELTKIAAGPKFAPRAETGISDLAGGKLAELAAALQGQEAPDEGTTAAFQNKDTARIATALLSQQGIGNRFSTDQVTQRKLAEKKSDAQNFINSADQVLKQLEKFNPNEDIAGASARAVEANLLPSSEAADLDRMLAGTTFEALKPTFPGQLSDAEREAMQNVMGRQAGVTVGKLKEILQRQKDKAALKFDTTLAIEQERGIKTDLKPFGAEKAAKEFDTPPPFDPITQRLLQNRKTGKFKVVAK